MIRGNCPACGRAYKVDDRYAGMTGQCKACGATITVPGTPDEGLNGLPPIPGAGHGEEAAPAPPGDEAPPQPSPAPQAPPSEQGPAQAGEARDERSRFEPSHGPTPLEGSWLKAEREPSESAPQAQAQPTGEGALPSTRLVTELEPQEENPPRPFLLSAGCVLTALIAIGFCLHMATGSWPFRVAGGVGLVLGVLGVVRIWRGHWDGLVPAFLCCFGVGGSFSVPSQVEAARIALLAGAALAALLLVVGAARRSGRDYFAR